ncbi:transcriptional repressor [Exilibacterium tricleocarpae]|uniref:Transcriptional repressor n=1 Tax=Exilibacterium tricleocarpae TaxID=2591008 RepID=A0A545SXM3_9GAMM|nr:transcriptional repressor [Exilibacterium tricleocarpae]TQV69718.1 transcriptional repressor [Exilibacterium tricleocarpae]
MRKSELNKIVLKAEEMCSHSGGRLTEKRKRILELLILSEVPLSAYEVADAYNKQAEKSMPAMSVYRMLDFLVAEQLAHKLASENKYVACSHIVCSHEHQVAQFLICRACHRVKEIAIQRNIVEALKSHVVAAGYQLMTSQLELDCVCENCLTTAA